jgi:hypothetical protein
MPPRPDTSDKLTHFTAGATAELAYQRLRTIMTEGRVIGHGDRIRGNYRCVCFTEAPLVSLENGLVNPSVYSRYSPFGVIFDKDWIFAQGGRPVVYQPDAEYDLLPQDLRWRHMRYEPGVVDFTWEREWRIQCDELSFAPSVAGLVVPDIEWGQRLADEHQGEQDLSVLQYAQIMDPLLAEQHREDFPWRIFVLGRES